MRSTEATPDTGFNAPAPTSVSADADAAPPDLDISAAGAGIRRGQRVAVLTASTAGIGLACAHALVARGYHVVVSSRDAGRVRAAVHALRAAAAGASASGLACHVGRAADRAALVQHVAEAARLAAPDGETGDGATVQAVVLNAAASTAYGPVLDTTEAQWDKIFDTNVRSTFVLLKALAPLYGHGTSIVVTSSIAAYNPLPGLGAYSVSKTALLGLVKALAVELGARGVRVNGVAPGIIRTRFSERMWRGGERSLAGQAAGGRRDEGMAKLFYIPARRLGRPEDVAGVVVFLLSDDAAYVTGETIVTAGGAFSKL